MFLKNGNLKKIMLTSIIALGLSLASHANAAEHYKFKFQSSDNSGSENFIAQQQWAKNVKLATNGRIVIDMLPVGTVVKHSETLDAISNGLLDGQITDTSYFAGEDPAFGLLGNTVGGLE